MTLRLYGVVPRARTFRNLWLLEEIGLAYEAVATDFLTDAIREPAYLALNPNARIPTLVDGDLVLWESLAINLYLAEHYGSALWPQTRVGRAEALKWTAWVLAEIDAPHDALRRRGDSLSSQEFERALSVLESGLGDRDYLIEGRFSVADVNVACVTIRPTLDQECVARHPTVAAWRERCLARPAFARALEISKGA